MQLIRVSIQRVSEIIDKLLLHELNMPARAKFPAALPFWGHTPSCIRFYKNSIASLVGFRFALNAVY